MDLANRPRLVTSEEALDGEQDGADVVGRGPLVLEDVEADAAARVDVGVEAARRGEPHLWAARRGTRSAEKANARR